MQEFQKYVRNSSENRSLNDNSKPTRESFSKSRYSDHPCHYYQSQAIRGSHFLTSSKLDSMAENMSVNTNTSNPEPVDNQYCAGCESNLIFKRTRNCACCKCTFCINCCSQQIWNEGRKKDKTNVMSG